MSSSMSSTLARRLLEDRSFSSNSRICSDFRAESGSFPGRLILSMQGSQCKKMVFIWNQMCELTSAGCRHLFINTCTTTVTGSLRGKDNSEDKDVDGRIILTLILVKYGWRGAHWIHLGPLAGFCDHGNELSDSIKGGKFLDWPNVLLPCQQGLCSVEFIRSLVIPTLHLQTAPWICLRFTSGCRQ
jgi:hypothetical protein